MRRYGMRDDQWERIQDLLPGRVGHVGVTAKDNRLFVEAVLYRQQISRWRLKWRRRELTVAEPPDTGAGRDGAVLWLGPGQDLLIGPIPPALPVRMGLPHAAHLPLPHRCLPLQTSSARKGHSPGPGPASGAAIATSSA